MRRSRVIDYAIYIAAGLTLSAAMAIPLILGIDPGVYEWRLFTALATFAAVGWLAYELRPWRKKPQYWSFLTFVVSAGALAG